MSMRYWVALAAAVIGLAVSAWMSQEAYRLHVDLLQKGDEIGEKLQMHGLLQHHGGTQHAQH